MVFTKRTARPYMVGGFRARKKAMPSADGRRLVDLGISAFDLVNSVSVTYLCPYFEVKWRNLCTNNRQTCLQPFHA